MAGRRKTEPFLRLLATPSTSATPEPVADRERADGEEGGSEMSPRGRQTDRAGGGGRVSGVGGEDEVNMDSLAVSM